MSVRARAWLGSWTAALATAGVLRGYGLWTQAAMHRRLVGFQWAHAAALADTLAPGLRSNREALNALVRELADGLRQKAQFVAAMPGVDRLFDRFAVATG